MNHRILMFLLLPFHLLFPVAANAQQDPKALIAKAINAMGGAERLRTPGGARRWVRSEFSAGKETYTGESFSSSPDRLKIVLKPDDPKRSTRILVLEGGKGWMVADGMTFNLDDTMLARLQRARHADRVSGLTTLLKKKGFQFEFLGETKVKEKQTYEIRVQYKGQPDIKLYFDRATGLLAKSWQKFIEAGTNQPALHELYYSDYQTFDSVKEDEELLKKAKLPLGGPALAQWLKKRTPSGAFRTKIKTLIQNLGAASFRVRLRSTVELKKIGVEAASLLREALGNKDREIAERAKECLDHIENDPAVQRIPAIVRLLAVRRPKGAVTILLDYIPWAPTNHIKNEVQAALYNLAKPDGKPDPRLLQALKSKDAIQREAAMAALGRDGGAYEKKPGRRIMIRGLKRSMRSEMYRNGQLRMRLQTLKVQYFNRLPDHIFARPGPEI